MGQMTQPTVSKRWWRLFEGRGLNQQCQSKRSNVWRKKSTHISSWRTVFQNWEGTDDGLTHVFLLRRARFVNTETLYRADAGLVSEKYF